MLWPRPWMSSLGRGKPAVAVADANGGSRVVAAARSARGATRVSYAHTWLRSRSCGAGSAS